MGLIEEYNEQINSVFKSSLQSFPIMRGSLNEIKDHPESHKTFDCIKSGLEQVKDECDYTLNHLEKLMGS